MKYYLVEHRSTGERFSAIGESKNRVKLSLTRFDAVSQQYHSFWTITEMAELELRKLKLDPVPLHYLS